jgi:transposase
LGRVYLQLQLLSRHRRDLVEKRAKLQCQIREYLGRCLPGYTALFASDKLWTRPLAIHVARKAATAEGVREAGVLQIRRWLRQQKIRFQSRSVEKIVAWAGNAAAADPLTPRLTRIGTTLDDDRQEKTRLIEQLEQELAAELVKTPYLLLLSLPGINVVSAAELAGEMGPIEYYAHAKAVTGRAGLFPSRYQSDRVDRADGPLSRFRNSRLRAAWLRVADNLVTCNAHYRGKAQCWKASGVDSRDIRCRVANRAARAVFRMVAGRELFRHPSRLERGYVLDKLFEFHHQRRTPPEAILRDLQSAAGLIPRADQGDEARLLKERYHRTRPCRRSGPEQIGRILIGVTGPAGRERLTIDSRGPEPWCQADRHGPSITPSSPWVVPHRAALWPHGAW